MAECSLIGMSSGVWGARPNPASWLLFPGCRYITCHLHNCSEKSQVTHFAGTIDPGSLTVQDNYIFLKVRQLVLDHVGVHCR